MTTPGQIGVYSEDGEVYVEIEPVDPDDETDCLSFSVSPEFARDLARLLTLASWKAEEDWPQ